MEIKKDGKFITITDKDFAITVNKNFIHLYVGFEEEGVYIQESISDLIEALYQAQSIYEELRGGE